MGVNVGAREEIDPVAALRNAPITGALDDEILRNLARFCAVRPLDRGQVLFIEGEPSESFFIVHSGRVRVIRLSDEGAELVLSVIGPGGVIGELSIFDSEPRSASVEAIEPCELVVVSNARVREVLSRSPESLLTVVSELATMVRRLTGSTADLVFLDLPHRVAKFLLLNRIDRADGSAHVEFAMSQSGVAAQLGVARQSFNTALGQLIREGWISVDGRKVTIHDIDALTQYVES
jgi:CRP-like cAMP-binding protein